MKNLENTLKKLLTLLEHYGAPERERIALALAYVFLLRLGVPPENCFPVLLNDVVVAKGTSLAFLTAFLRAWLRSAEGSFDELLLLLRKARVEDRLLEFFPQQRRNAEAFGAHFSAESLPELVAHAARRFSEARAGELTDALGELVEGGGSVAEAVELLSGKGPHAEGEAVGPVWAAVCSTVDSNGKAGQQAAASLVKAVRGWAKLLTAAVAGSAKAEAELLSRVQSSCYEDSALRGGKGFAEAVRHLYDKDVVSEAAVLAWYRKGANPKGRAGFVKELEPFVTWLQEAEEESEEDDPK